MTERRDSLFVRLRRALWPQAGGLRRDGPSPGRANPVRVALQRHFEQLLVEARSHPDARVRASAVDELACRADPRAKDAILAAVDDPSPEVRATAIRALARDGGPRVPDILVRVLGEADRLGPWTTAEAAGALAARRQAEPRAVPVLIGLLSSRRFMVRQAAAKALDALGWAPTGGDERLALAVAACDWEVVAEFGPAAARPLAAALAEGDWEQESDEPHEMNDARGVLEDVLTRHAAQVDDEVLDDLACLDVTFRAAMPVGEASFEYVDLGNCDRIRELATEELARRSGLSSRVPTTED